MLNKINVDRLFDFIVISSEENIVKPDPIDDNIINVEAAQSIGIDAILFENVQQLKEKLMNYNIVL